MDKFDADVVAAVVAHMGEDHAEDNLVIARAFGAPEATKSVFVNLDSGAGYWRVTEGGVERELRVPWPSGPISERPEIRREVVLVHKEAAKRLGLAPAQEAEGSKPFSQVLREGSWGDHDDSEGADFMASIMRGTASLEDYIQLVEQHYFMYEALEDVAEELKDDPGFAPFYEADLLRMQALTADLQALRGDNWRETIQATPATRAYAERIREVGAAEWIPGIVAHHYTRYLGDLSGGQMIARQVAKQHGFTDSVGVAFYKFESLGSIGAFKQRYREALDALGLSMNDAEQQRMLDEVRKAYRFNTEVFIDLAQLKSVTV